MEDVNFAKAMGLLEVDLDDLPEFFDILDDDGDPGARSSGEYGPTVRALVSQPGPFGPNGSHLGGAAPG